MISLILLLLLSICAWGQTPSSPQQISMLAPVPPVVNPVNLQVVGPLGNSTYYVNVVTNYPIGSIVSNAFVIRNAPTTLTSGNYIRANWNPADALQRDIYYPTLQITYTVLMSTSPLFTAGSTGTCTNCIVVQNITSPTYNIQSAPSGSYTLNPIGQSGIAFFLDNRNYAPSDFYNGPRLYLRTDQGQLPTFDITFPLTFSAPPYVNHGTQCLGVNNEGDVILQSCGGGSTVSITAISPIVVTPSPITGTGVVSCPTCIGSGSSVFLPVYYEWVAGICQDPTPGQGLSSPSVNPGVTFCIQGSNTVLGVSQFTATGQSIQSRFIIPEDWTSGAGNNVDFRFLSESAGAAGNIVWALQTACAANTGASIDPAFNAAQTASIAATANNTTNVSSISTFTSTGCSAGQILFFKITLDASTTATGNIDLLSARFRIIRNVVQP